MGSAFAQGQFFLAQSHAVRLVEHGHIAGIGLSVVGAAGDLRGAHVQGRDKAVCVHGGDGGIGRLKRARADGVGGQLVGELVRVHLGQDKVLLGQGHAGRSFLAGDLHGDLDAVIGGHGHVGGAGQLAGDHATFVHREVILAGCGVGVIAAGRVTVCVVYRGIQVQLFAHAHREAGCLDLERASPSRYRSRSGSGPLRRS